MSKRVRLFVLNDTHPLRICKPLAEEIGFNESIVLLQLEYLIGISNTKVIDDELWTRQSAANLKDEHFPWWSIPTISRIINNLANGKPGKYEPLIKLGNYNKFSYDRTQWIALNRDGIAKLKSIKIDNAIFQNEKWNRANCKMEPRKMRNGTAQNEKWISQNEKSIRAKCNDDTLDSYPDSYLDSNPETTTTHDPADTTENDDAGHRLEPVVVVVGADGVEWPLDEIKNTAGLTFLFRDTDQAKTYISKWLYALSPEGNGINTPARWAKSHMDDDPDPRYLEIVEAGPTRITTSYWGAGAHVEALRKAGVATLLTKMIPDLAQPEPEIQNRPQDDPQDTSAPEVPSPKPRIFTKNGLAQAPNKAWAAAMGQMQMEIPRAAFDQWVRDLVLLDYDSDQQIFIVGSPNALSRNWVDNRLGVTLSRLLTGITNKSVELQVTTWDEWETSE